MPKSKSEATSLHDPVEITIGGQVYVARPWTGKVIREIETLDEKVRGGSMSAMYDRLAYLLPDAKPQVIENLVLREVIKHTNDIIKGVLKSAGEEKNAPEPGDEKSQ